MFFQDRRVNEKWPYLAILFFVFLVLVLLNFPYKKWLLGWDNLVPEFNFAVNIRRALFLWQENEGLGVFSGHGYPATLLHSLFLLFLSLFLPIYSLRPIFIFLMLILGALGCFFLTGKLFEMKKKGLVYPASLLASLYYMLNFGTLQTFYIPLEAFVFHFTSLPWLLFSLILVFQKPKRKSFALFTLVSFLSSPQGFIPPLFLVYFLFLIIFCFAVLFKKRDGKSLKLAAVVVATTIAVNAYWLLPLGYYTLRESSVYLNAYNNLMTTEDFILKNKKFGQFEDLVFLRSFFSEARDADETGKHFYIFTPWQEHLENPSVKMGAYFVFLLILLGIFSSLERGTLFQKIFIGFFLLSFIFLATNIFPFSLVSGFLRDNVSIFRQAFRIAFTKFSLSLSLFYALFLAGGVLFLLDSRKLGRFNKALFFMFGFLILFLSWPSFQGNFFYQRIKVDLPKEYLKLFDFFKKQDPSLRIANFPQPIPTGWLIYRWGYTGSGFLWYGLAQPILDRNFDVWSNFNENYYWEISYALYSEKRELFEKVLEKYQVSWLLVDENVIGYIYPKSLYFERLEKLIEGIRGISLAAEFGKIRVYRTNWAGRVERPYLIEARRVEPSYAWGNFDRGYFENGDYYSILRNGGFSAMVYYPFRSLFTGRRQEELEFEIEDKKEEYIIKSSILRDYDMASFNKGLLMPKVSGELLEVDRSDLGKRHYFQPQISLKKKTEEAAASSSLESERGILKVRIPKVWGLYSYDSGSDFTLEEREPIRCDKFRRGPIKRGVIWQEPAPSLSGVRWRKPQKNLRFSSQDASNCLDINLPQLPHRLSYIVSVESRNIKGKPFLFSVINQNSRRADLEIYLPKISNVKRGDSLVVSYFILPPMEEYGRGYTLHFDNISIGREETVNDLGRITVNPFPYKFLTGLKVVESFGDRRQTYPVLAFGQSFDWGWKAYKVKTQKFKVQGFLNKYFPFILGEEAGEHVLVNNWANGWLLKDSEKTAETRYQLLFWPQYLEYLGFLLLGISLGIIVYKSCKVPEDL